jgi:uncharacterized protein
MTHAKNILILLFLAFVVLYVVGVVVVYFQQRKLQYFPSHRDASGVGNSLFKPFRDQDGTFLGYVREVPAPKQIIIFFHGNGGEALDRTWVSEIAPSSTIVYLAEYVGYGPRPGIPTEKAIFADAERLFDEASKKWQVPVTLMGESLGTGVASYLASRRPAERLALIAPFSSLQEVAAFHYPFLPIRWLLQDRYLSTDFLKTVNIPLHIIHGQDDAIIPIALGCRLFNSYPGTVKTFSEIPGVEHNDIYDAIMRSPKAEAFRKFLFP